ncbi:MAG: hypothetical protein JWN34_5060 [Bryobacterales bacterium]|nr:hypothetical protein [Bryobacterales bacterium]
MAILWRPATWPDIESTLPILVKQRGDSLVGAEAAEKGWRRLYVDPFSTATVIESSSPSGEHRIVGFGASAIVSSSFADAEILHPRPDINSRVIANIVWRRPVLATRSEIACANAHRGVDVVVLCGVWLHDLLEPAEQQEVKTLLATSFVETHAGYRIRRILCETVDKPSREFVDRSIVYDCIGDFPEAERAIHLMTAVSAGAVPGSLGNVLFNFREPVLCLRDSDQELLIAAVNGATDAELATELGASMSAVKGRWRSVFAQIGNVMPGLVTDSGGDVRGSQKRHLVLAYLRRHPEELRPYDQKSKGSQDSGAAQAYSRSEE